MQHVLNQPTPTQPTLTQSLPAQYGFNRNTNTPVADYNPGTNTHAPVAPSYNPSTSQPVSAALVPASNKLTTSKKSLEKREARYKLRDIPESERQDRDLPCRKCATAMAKSELVRGRIDEVQVGRIACTVKKEGEADDARCLECRCEGRICLPVCCCFSFVP